MFGTKISSVLAGGILLLGSSAIALAQAGGPPEELPEDAATRAHDQVETLELGNETATRAVEEGGLGGGESDGDGTAFSDWVKSLDLEGCERGLTIAANARTGPTDFDPATAVEVDPEHPALEAGCADETVSGASDGGPDEPGAQGRFRAEEARGERDGEVGSTEAGPTGDAGPPAGAGPPADAGPPSDAGPPNGR